MREGMRCGAALLLVVGASAALAQTRPTKLTILPGVAEMRDVVYEAGTSNDFAQPAAGTGTLVFIVKDRQFPKPGVRFTNTMMTPAGQVTGFAAQLEQPFILENLFATGAGLTIPTGQLTYQAPDKLILTGEGSARLPFRNKDGTPIELGVRALVGSVDASGNGRFLLDDVSLKGTAATQGIFLPGANLKPTTADATTTWTASTSAAWKLEVASCEANVGIPGVSSDPEYPVRATVTNLVVTQDGTITFDEAVVVPGPAVKAAEAPGFEFTVKEGRVRMPAAGPVFTAVKMDLTFPKGVTKEGTNDRLTVTNLLVTMQNGGLSAQVGSVRGSIQSVTLEITDAVLDLSVQPSNPPLNLPAPFNAPEWTGLFIKTGNLLIPTGGQDKLTMSCANFVVEPAGVSGTTALASNAALKVGGFGLTSPSGQVELLRSQLKKVDLSGKVKVGTFPELDAKVGFDLAGNVSFQIKADQALQLPELGVKIDQLKGQIEEGLLTLSGDMGFDIPSAPGGFKNLQIAVKDLKVTPAGELRLPTSALVTLPEPEAVPLGPVEIELRQFGFTTDGSNRIESIIFTGGAALKGMEDVLPISGELDFEGVTIGKSSSGPQVQIDGFGLKAEVLGIGSLAASLAYDENLPGFGSALYGDAQLTLTCLGEMKTGIGLEFLVAPVLTDPLKSSFFVGGNVTIPPILIQIPPAGPNPPVPLFNIVGFSGGFGLNVDYKPGERGRISDPATQLTRSQGALLQAGILVADPAPGPATGKIWWADTTLTLTLNPVTVDLTARASFLDMAGYGFIDLDEWRDRDRIAEIFLNIDFGTPALSVGGSADLTFPTRSANLVQAEGEAELRVGKNETFLRIGWEPEQRPLKLTFLKAFEGMADISAKAGLELKLPQIEANTGRRIGSATGKMFLCIEADVTAGGIEATAKIEGDLILLNIGERAFSASGSLSFDGNVDFGFFSANARGVAQAAFNTSRLPGGLYMDVTVTGQVAGFEETISFPLSVRGA